MISRRKEESEGFALAHQLRGQARVTELTKYVRWLMRRQGTWREHVPERLRLINRHRCLPPLTNSELTKLFSKIGAKNEN